VQDQIAQMLFCVAIGGVLSFGVAGALSRPRGRPALPAILPRLAVAAGPVYLAAEYVLYQGAAVTAAAMAAFALGFCALRGWWLPQRPAATAGLARHGTAAEPARPGPDAAPVLYLLGSRKAAASAALRSRVLAVVRDDRRSARPDDRSMPSAA
jgi:hypothetical protein